MLRRKEEHFLTVIGILKKDRETPTSSNIGLNIRTEAVVPSYAELPRLFPVSPECTHISMGPLALLPFLFLFVDLPEFYYVPKVSKVTGARQKAEF